MGHPKGRPKKSGRDDVTVKIDRGVVEQAKLVALRRKISVAELLTELLRAPVRRAYNQCCRNLREEGEG